MTAGWTDRFRSVAPGRVVVYDAVATRLGTELQRILHEDGVKERFGQQGADATFPAPAGFVAFKAERAKWGPVVKATGAKVD